MTTVERLIKQYETTPKLQKEVKDILADGKVTMDLSHVRTGNLYG